MWYNGGMRTATFARQTSESNVSLSLNLDGTGKSSVDTSVPFLDHLLTAFSKHSLIDLEIKASGDTEIDIHHTAEDVAISLGTALKEALGDKRGITRFGAAFCPLDEALTRAVVDISGRPYLVHQGEPEGFEFHLIAGHFTGSMVRHIFEAVCFNAGICAHIDVLRGRDPHHIAETEFKAFARALREAVRHDAREGDQIPSTKGVL